MSCLHAREICWFCCFAYDPSLGGKTFVWLRRRDPTSRPGCALQPPRHPGFIPLCFRQRLGRKLSRGGSSPALPLTRPAPRFCAALQLSRGAHPLGDPAGTSAPLAGPPLCPSGRARSSSARASLLRTMARGRGSRPAVGMAKKVFSGGQGLRLSPLSPRPASQ